MSEPVSTTIDGSVATITLGQPALNVAVKEALRDALAAVAVDRSVRAVILTGTGSTFCVGQDLAEHAANLESAPERSLNTVDEHYNPIVRSIVSMPKPVIAAVNGTCVGAGFGFALACDLMVLSNEAKLGTAFTGIGLTCDSGLSWTLQRAVGLSRARRLVMLPMPFPAADAVAWGLAAELVAPDQVLSVATQLAVGLAAGPTAAYAESKALLDQAASCSLDQALDAEGPAQQRLGLTQDHQGAVKSFLAKEKPRFTGH